MRNVIKVLVILLLVGTATGLAVLGISKARQQAALIQCQSNLKQIGLAVNCYHDVHQHFPKGTLANSALPPDKRFSWFIEIYPACMYAGPVMLLDKGEAWDAPINCPPRDMFVSNPDLSIVRGERVAGDLAVFICPANPARAEASLPGVTHYVGIAGLGGSAAELPLSNANAGFFGYDRTVTRQDLQHGSATTIMAAETLRAGLWTAGGPSTVRGLTPDKLTYFGEGGQFASKHSAGANVLFADSSVRTLGGSVAVKVVEAMAALAGDKAMANFDE